MVGIKVVELPLDGHRMDHQTNPRFGCWTTIIHQTQELPTLHVTTTEFLDTNTYRQIERRHTSLAGRERESTTLCCAGITALWDERKGGSAERGLRWYSLFSTYRSELPSHPAWEESEISSSFNPEHSLFFPSMTGDEFHPISHPITAHFHETCNDKRF